MTTISLQDFGPEELIFDERETKEILIFFFPADSKLIEESAITDGARSFAQSLLIAAIDASYAMGYVDALFSGFYTAMPHKKLTFAYMKLASKGSKNWFRHRKNKSGSLKDVKVYESVRKSINRDFRSMLGTAMMAKRSTNTLLAFNVHPHMAKGIVWSIG